MRMVQRAFKVIALLTLGSTLGACGGTSNLLVFRGVMNPGGEAGDSRVRWDHDTAYASGREEVRVFVETPQIGQAALDATRIDQQRLETELTRALRHSLGKWGRFRTVSRKERASVIVRCDLNSVVVWAKPRVFGDTRVIEGSEDDMGGFMEGFFQSIGLDAHLSLVLEEKDTGDELASNTVTGRILVKASEVFVTNTEGVRSGYERAGGGVVTVDPNLLPPLLEVSLDGAIYSQLARIDDELWTDELDDEGDLALRERFRFDPADVASD